jgi:choline dehydrogenase
VEDVPQRHPGALADLGAGTGAHRAAPRSSRPADAGGAGVDFRATVVSRLAQRLGHTVSNSCVLLHPQSRGKVSLRSADPRDKPKIQLNLLQAEADREGLRNIVKFVRRFYSAAPATELVAQELAPGPAVQSDADIDAWLRANVRTAMHPTSTCAMGRDDMSVVDGQLRVHGLSGLRIADASIMPTIVGGNTNAPTIMIAEKAVDLILGRAA